MSKFKSCLSLIVLLIAGQAQAQDFYECSANSPCQVVVRPGMGWHIKLTDIAKGYKYNCHIDGIAALGNLNQEEANKIGIVNAQLNRLDYHTATLSFDSMNLNVLDGYLFFDMENSSDIPVTDTISCEKSIN